jgi:hypothetical protein
MDAQKQSFPTKELVVQQVDYTRSMGSTSKHKRTVRKRMAARASEGGWATKEQIEFWLYAILSYYALTNYTQKLNLMGKCGHFTYTSILLLACSSRGAQTWNRN